MEGYRIFAKKLAVGLQLSILLMVVTACGNIHEFVEEEVSVEQTVFKGAILETPDIEGEPGAFVVSDSGDEVLVSPYRKIEKKECARLYIMNLNTQKAQLLPNPDMTDEDDYLAILFDHEDNRLAIYSTNARRTAKHTYYLVKWDKEGNLVSKVDVSGSMKGADQGNRIDILMDEKNRLVIVTESKVIVITEEGEQCCVVFSENGKIECAACTKDGRIICGIRQDKKAKIQMLNVEREEFDKPIELGMDLFEDVCALKNGTDYDFYYRDNSAFYGYDMKEGIYRKVLDIKDSEIDTGMEWDIVPISKEKMLGTTFDKKTGKIYLILFTK